MAACGGRVYERRPVNGACLSNLTDVSLNPSSPPEIEQEPVLRDKAQRLGQELIASQLAPGSGREIPKYDLVDAELVAQRQNLLAALRARTDHVGDKPVPTAGRERLPCGTLGRRAHAGNRDVAAGLPQVGIWPKLLAVLVQHALVFLIGTEKQREAEGGAKSGRLTDR